MMAPTPSAVSWPAPSVRLRLCWPASPASASSMFIGFFTKSQLRGSLAPVASSSFDLVAIRKAPRRTHLASYKLILGCLFGRRHYIQQRNERIARRLVRPVRIWPLSPQRENSGNRQDVKQECRKDDVIQ